MVRIGRLMVVIMKIKEVEGSMVEWCESNGYGGNKQINGSEGGGEGR